MVIVFVGVDLAKNVFALQGGDEAGKAALVRPAVRRVQLLVAVAELPSLNTTHDLSPGISPTLAFDDASHRSDRQQVNSGLLLSGIPSSRIPRRTNGALLSGSHLGQRHVTAHKAVCRWAVCS
jgi:hypothetical protein